MGCVSGYLFEVNIKIGTVDDFHQPLSRFSVETGSAVCINISQISRLVGSVFHIRPLGSLIGTVTQYH